nr:biotin/lipoyl-binding protein [Planctomycetota bacterium]
MRTALFAFVLCAIVGCGAGGGHDQGHGGGGMPPPSEVAIYVVVERLQAEWQVTPGRLEAVQTVEIRPRVSGFLERVAVLEGALVKPGDLLLELDPRPFTVAVQRAEAQVADATARRGQAQKDAARAKELLEAKAFSSEEAEQRESALAVATAAVAVAEAAASA